MKKYIFSTFLCAICLIFSFGFAGCGETRSFKEVSNIYNEIMGTYRGTFFNQNNEVSITYSSAIQYKIDSASSNSLYYNLKKDDNDSSAFFEPALKANVFVTEYFINWNVENYKNVPGEEMNALYESASGLKEKLYNLKRIKISLEAASNPDNWIVDYRQAFYETIVSYNNFSQQFLNVFEKYVNEDSAPDGRISVAKTQLEFAKKVIEAVDIVCDYYIKDNIDKSFLGDDVISINFVAIYREAKSVFEGEKFQSIINRDKTEYEVKMIETLKNIEKYNSFFENETKKVKNILKNNSYSDLKDQNINGTIKDDDKVLLNKLNDYSHTFAVMKSYMATYKNALIEYENNA